MQYDRNLIYLHYVIHTITTPPNTNYFDNGTSETLKILDAVSKNNQESLRVT